MTDDPTTKSMPPTAGSSVQPEPATFQLNPGDRVGNYVIREQIGEGRFGSVWIAAQREPVKRRLPLKIIKRGTDTTQLIPRFSPHPHPPSFPAPPSIPTAPASGSPHP